MLCVTPHGRLHTPATLQGYDVFASMYFFVTYKTALDWSAVTAVAGRTLEMFPSLNITQSEHPEGAASPSSNPSQPTNTESEVTSGQIYYESLD